MIFGKKKNDDGGAVIQDLTLEEPKKDKSSYLYVLIGLGVAVLIFAGLVYLERYINTPKHSEMTVVAAKTIPKGTILTEDNQKEYLTGVMMDTAYRPSDAEKSTGNLLGRKLTVKVAKGGIVTMNDTVDSKSIEEAFTDPVEVSMTVTPENADVGLLRRGDLFSIISTRQGSDDEAATSEYTAENLYVLEAFDGDGNRIDAGDKITRATVLQLKMEKNAAADLSNILSDGSTIRIVKVVNTDEGYKLIREQAKEEKADEEDTADSSDDAETSAEPSAETPAEDTGAGE